MQWYYSLHLIKFDVFNSIQIMYFNFIKQFMQKA